MFIPGKREEESKSATLGVCESPCSDAGLLEKCGCVRYTDNYYISVKLARHMFEKYGWTTLGTFVPTNKKHQEADEFPFHKLSNGARNSVGRGWFREASIHQAEIAVRYHLLYAGNYMEGQEASMFHLDHECGI